MEDGEDLGDDRRRDLLRPVRTDIETSGGVQDGQVRGQRSRI